MPDVTMCDGGGDSEGDHCCYVGGVACNYLVVDGPTGRRYACGLFTELGDWALVESDPRYVADVQPTWTAAGVYGCGDWMGANNATWVAIKGRGEITEQELIDNAQCCFARLWGADTTAQRRRQAVRAINRWIN